MTDAVSLVGISAPPKVTEALTEALAGLVKLAAPQAIVVFGSYATATADATSDIDLVVVAQTEDRWELASRLYLAWHRMRQRSEHLPPADILVYTPEQFAAAQVVGFPAYEAATEGVVVHGQLPEASGAMAG